MDLTYFDNNPRGTSYPFVNAISEVQEGTKTLEEAANLHYNTLMWKWYDIYQVLNAQGKTIVPDQPTLDQALESITEYFRVKFKAYRTETVANSTVTIGGKVYDADEDSQRRLMAAILSAIDDEETTVWVLHDNSVTFLNRPQLKEILRACTLQMSSIWVDQ